MEVNVLLASFRFDVTPPIGHPLCGGLVPAASRIDDRLEANGVVIVGEGPPIVIVAVDWTGIANESHAIWKRRFADVAKTSVDRIIVHAVHQHDAPYACLESDKLLAASDCNAHIIDSKFFHDSIERGAKELGNALRRLTAVTHVGYGQAKVNRIASNRRIVSRTGQLTAWRPSSSREWKHRWLPEGLVDPLLKTVVFFRNKERLASLHYYAVHPMSVYRTGGISSDFIGLARRWSRERTGSAHIYFTGCSGDIAAGRYNNGKGKMRRKLAKRLFVAIVGSPGTELEFAL